MTHASRPTSPLALVKIELPGGSVFVPRWRGPLGEARLGAALATAAGYRAVALPATDAAMASLARAGRDATVASFLGGK